MINEDLPTNPGQQIATQFVTQLPKDLTSKLLHEKFTKYGSNAKEWIEKCALLLPEINKRKIWAAKGFRNIYHYAACLAGMNHDKVNESLRVLGKTADKPALRKVIEKKGINAVKPIVTIASAETQEFWAEKAMQLTKNELETYVRDFRNGRVVNDSGNIKNPSLLQISRLPRKAESANLFGENLLDVGDAKTDKTTSENTSVTPLKKILMELSPETVSKLEKLKGDSDWETLMQKFLSEREAKIEETKPEARETTSRHVPAKIKRFVVGKYNGRCAFLGCNKPYSELHHTERFFFENKHDPSTIIPLCASHHSLAHKGLIEEGTFAAADPASWRLRQVPELGLVDKMVLAHKSST